jgi:hypothetical protein
MALSVHTATGAGSAVTLAAPTTSQTIAYVAGQELWAIVGGTATTIGIVIPGNTAYGSANPDISSGAISNATWRCPIPRAARDDDGNVTITFSQVTGVTAIVLSR